MHIFKWIAVVLIAIGLKLHYSTAGVDELRWILAPTAILVEWTTWTSFSFESHFGYMSSDHTFLIAASCSGVNFLIAAFLMLSMRKLWRSRSDLVGWNDLFKAAVLAFVATVIANAIRISIAMQMRDLAPAIEWVDSGELHRIQGIIVYFGSLLLLFVLTDRKGTRDHSHTARFPSLFRRSLWPLAVYYSVTLAVPIANGAFGLGNMFWRHSLFVLLTPILLIAMISILRAVKPHRSDRGRLVRVW